MPLKLLQHRYAMGITPLREALTVLSGTGLIVSDDSGRGFHVATASPADFADIVQCRRRLEAMALRLSIGAAGDDWRRDHVRSIATRRRACRRLARPSHCATTDLVLAYYDEREETNPS